MPRAPICSESLASFPWEARPDVQFLDFRESTGG